VTLDEPAEDPTVAPAGGTAADGAEAEVLEGDGTAAADEPPRPVPKRWQLWTVVIAIAVLFVMNQIGNIVGPSWVNAHPVGLLCLTGLMRWQILTVNLIDPVWVFIVVGGARLLIADPFFYLLGLWYGESAFVWIERRSTTLGEGARKLSGYFRYVSYPLVMIMPNNPVCVLAGVNRMRPVVFAVLNVIGTIGRLILIIWLGKKLQEPIDAVLDFIKEYRWYLIALSVPFVVLATWREASRNLDQLATIRRGSSEDGESSD
jgi:membrane protein DedA with SNARE-associated domain